MKRAVLFGLCLLAVACGTGQQRPIIHTISRFVSFGRLGSASAPTVGEVLTTTNGTWTNSPTGYTYQWQRCSGACTNIAGATSSSYTVQSADLGDTIQVIVTASNSAGSASQTSSQTGTVQAASTFSPLHVSGGQLLNQTNQTVVLHGVNRGGTEYSCLNNNGFFDGTGTSTANEDAQLGYMQSWGVNAVLIGLNEDCWLGINSSPAAYSNSASSPPTPGCTAAQCPYANAIENLVQTAEADHLYPVISLFHLAPGTTQASGHINIADNDHAPLFWEEVADFFKSDPYVQFRLEQEPAMWYSPEANWQCWAQGDVSYSTTSVNAPPTAPTSTGTPNKCETPGITTYQAVGMQSLVNIVRGTGATNIIWLSGLSYSNMVSCATSQAPSSCGMLAATTPPVTDPNSPAQLAASVDVYPDGNACGSTSCYDTTYKPVAQTMPFLAGEMAENPNNGYAPTTLVDQFMSWMDTNASGYFAYAWDPWGNLTPDYTSNQTNPYRTTWGADFYDHINGISLPAPTQPTGTISFPLYLTVPCNSSLIPSGTITFPGPVNAGDDLFAVAAAYGYNQTAPAVTGISDNVNGAWTALETSGSQASGSLNVSYSLFKLTNSQASAGGLTLTVTGTAGGGSSTSPPSVAIIDARGVSSVASAVQSTIQAASTSEAGPALTNVTANDVVLGLFGSYSGNNPEQDYQATSPWHTSVTNLWTSGIDCAAAAIDWEQPAATGTVTSTIGSLQSMPYYGATIDLHP